MMGDMLVLDRPQHRHIPDNEFVLAKGIDGTRSDLSIFSFVVAAVCPATYRYIELEARIVLQKKCSKKSNREALNKNRENYKSDLNLGLRTTNQKRTKSEAERMKKKYHVKVDDCIDEVNKKSY
ncbi:hypothetical protein RUM43_012815 [Polyplax serrata]|uniref:Uncharacterized protein n=1 Tax=Polyplax serrata TaxID=468196 RepID=A0AAN8S436_POLSC